MLKDFLEGGFSILFPNPHICFLNYKIGSVHQYSQFGGNFLFSQ